MTSMKEEVVEGFQLSPQQKRLYTSSQVEGRTPYRTLCAVLIEGESEPGRLEAAVEEVVARHEILRTTFRRLPGLSVPVQVIGGEGGALRLGRHDLRGSGEAEQSALLEEHFREAKRLGFDFENGPLLRLSLFRLAADRSVLTLCMPAACSDASGRVSEPHRALTAVSICVRSIRLTSRLRSWGDAYAPRRYRSR